MDTLSDLVSRRLRELDLTYRQAAEASGGRVSESMLGQIARGSYERRLTDRTARGLAVALDVPLVTIRDLAGEPTEERVLPKKAARLSAREWRIVLEVIDALLAAKEADKPRAEDLARDRRASDRERGRA